MRSSDARALLVVTVPPGATNASRLLSEVVAAVRRGYRGVRGTTGAREQIGGRPARSAVLTGRNRRGATLRILLSAVKGRRRTYLVEVFTAQSAPPARLVEARLALDSLRLRG